MEKCTRVLRIQDNLLPVYGSNETGWSVEENPGCLPPEAKYNAFWEIYFVIINLSLCPEGQA